MHSCNIYYIYKIVLVFYFKIPKLSYMIGFSMSQQNDIAERKHHHIVETTRFLLLFAYDPSEF